MLSLNCKDCPIYNSCEMKMSIACNFVYPVVALMMNRASISKKKPIRRNRETIKIKNYERRKKNVH